MAAKKSTPKSSAKSTPKAAKPTPKPKSKISDVRKTAQTKEYKAGYARGVKESTAAAKYNKATYGPESVFFSVPWMARDAETRGYAKGRTVGFHAEMSRRKPRKQGD
jgi:hypothetical protein